MNNRGNSLRFYELSESFNARLVHGGQVVHQFPRHMHHSWSVGVVERGFRQFETRKETFIISAGECFIIPPRLPHTCQTSVDSWHEYWILCVPQQVIQQIFSPLYIEQQRFPTFLLGPIRDVSLVQLMRNFVKEVQQGGDLFTQKTLLLDIINHCLLHHTQEPPNFPELETPHEAVNIARDYLEQHFDQPITLEELADAAAMSPFHLSRIFQRIIGIPPYEYLVKIRLQYAQTLLKRGESIASTAYSTGFSDQSHFTRFFKRHIGLTPGEYSRAAREVLSQRRRIMRF